MPVIPTSEGRLIDVPEGVLRLPPVVPAPKRQTKVRPRAPTKKGSVAGLTTPRELKRAEKFSNLVGYKEWLALRTGQIQRNAGYQRTGKYPGTADGYRNADMIALKERVRIQVAKDMEKIKQRMNLDDKAEEALGTAIEIMRLPGQASTRLQAARMVLEWTRAKPASESKVTVNQAEAWLASLDDGPDDEPQDD